jgi:23S rRNA pseudouridine1911/1915/1917 synthase
LALHARSLSFRHPVTGEELTFEAKAPAYFKELVGSLERLRAEQTPVPGASARR